ncbi:diaminopimelate epimerase [Lewinellaceae bacterium SD302]|nr:diaminopimelate epimerase [Lewinellaceae bacterium SD302]
MLHFHKYEGAGNDFILIDARATLPFPLNDQATIQKLCDRHFGIGADGLMLLRNHDDYDFKMVYYNADGAPSSMCGNGGRCIVAFAKRLGIIGNECSFLAVDGPHLARVLENGNVVLAMSNVNDIEISADSFILDTGSPHYIKYQENIGGVKLISESHAIRYNDRFRDEGINVNFVEILSDNSLGIRTYERGVEDETLACGTGVTAAAISLAIKNGVDKSGGRFDYRVQAVGGQLSVSGTRQGDRFTDLELEGPATFVFSGDIKIGD